MLYVITDTHFGHTAFKKYKTRPNDYEDQIISNWKKMVTNNDVIIHLGDVAEDNNKLMIEKFLSLPGKKILIRGNHDTESIEEYINCGIEFCCDELVMTLSDVCILFTHMPKYRHEYDINIHGHLHCIYLFSKEKLFLPLSLEVMGYSPIPIDDNFLKKLKYLVENFNLYNKIPSPDQIKSFGVSPIVNLRNIDLTGREYRNEKSDLLFRRMQIEYYIDINSIDCFLGRDKIEEAKRLYIRGLITLEEFQAVVGIVTNS